MGRRYSMWNLKTIMLFVALKAVEAICYKYANAEEQKTYTLTEVKTAV